MRCHQIRGEIAHDYVGPGSRSIVVRVHDRRRGFDSYIDLSTPLELEVERGDEVLIEVSKSSDVGSTRGLDDLLVARLGAFLAGEGTVTMTELRETWQQLGYVPTFDDHDLADDAQMMVVQLRRDDE